MASGRAIGPSESRAGRAVRARSVRELAEREGFEPSMQVTPHGGLANRCTRPLCDLSVATAAGILSWASEDPAHGRHAGHHQPSADHMGRAMAGRDRRAEPRRRADPPGRIRPAWPALYEREAARIRSLLGDRVRLLEHAGSTSVPGLAAKPIIDIELAVADSADEPAYVPDLEAGGYVLHGREPDWFEHRLFKGTDPAVNLHVFSAGSPEIDRTLAFRDRLRTDEDDRRPVRGHQARAGGPRLGLRPGLRRCQGRDRRGDPRAGLAERAGRALMARPALTSSAPVDTVRPRT